MITLRREALLAWVLEATRKLSTSMRWRACPLARHAPTAASAAATASTTATVSTLTSTHPRRKVISPRNRGKTWHRRSGGAAQVGSGSLGQPVDGPVLGCHVYPP